jgi:YidC/Oxa1 family membrane protein insertase
MNRFSIFAGIILSLVVGCGFARAQAEANKPSQVPQMREAPPSIEITAQNNVEASRVLGSTDKKSGYKFQLELTNTGASVSKATLADFNDRNREHPQKLVIMQPARLADNTLIYPLESGALTIDSIGKRLPLNVLNWKAGEVTTTKDGTQSAEFTALITTEDAKSLLRVTKTYTVKSGSNDFNCKLSAENLWNKPLTINFDMFGPAGVQSEDISTSKTKSVVVGRPDLGVMGAFTSADGITVSSYPGATLKKGEPYSAPVVPKKAGPQFIWAAATNKYFAAIMRPVPEGNSPAPGYIATVTAEAANFTSGQKLAANSNFEADDTTAVQVQTGPQTLAAAGSPASRQTYDFQVYLGPKDKDLFESNPLYQQLGYYHTIEFSACCTLGLTDALSFAILALMKWVHTALPFINYGWIIIVLVLLVRLILHPITKASQVSMMKMQKLGPMAEEIKKKYADNKQEMSRRLAELYKEQGPAGLLGCLPMLLQMPIWIALYSAIYAGIALRGAHFLPFWITDLSGPDAVWTFPTLYIPLLSGMMGPISSINILPILLAVAMYMQQKLTPTSAPPTSGAMSDQMRQQQKIMLVMMPVMMLLFLYNAPSGLNLYIMASTFGGVIEQYVIRKHIREREAEAAEVLVPTTSKLGGKVKKKKPKPFFRTGQ